jgi:tetratricopeptide (TPR) repeat protein
MAHEHIVYMMLVDSAAMVGDEAAIRKFVPVLQDLAERDDHRPYLAVAKRAAGIAQRIAGKHKKAEELFKAALEIFGEMDAQWQLGRTFYQMGELELARSNPDQAEGYFAQALEAFENVGAGPDIARTNAARKQLA